MDVHCKVTVTERKPSFCAKRAKRAHKVPGFLRAAPTTLRIGEIGKRVEDSVEIGRDIEPEMFEIIPGIHHNCQGFAEQPVEAERELGTADAAT